MKWQKQLLFGLSLVVFVLLIKVATVFAASMGSSKNYYLLTTVYYNNEILDGGSSGWNARYSDTTNPSRSMDQFHVTVWTVYISCNFSGVTSTYTQYQNINSYNVTYLWNAMAKSKVNCPPAQTRRLHNYVQHWWQDNGNPGAGGTLNQAVIN